MSVAAGVTLAVLDTQGDVLPRICKLADPPFAEGDLYDQRTNMSSTFFLLMAQYGGRTILPIDQVCRDFFGHLTVDKLLRKALRGDLALPIVRIEKSEGTTRRPPGGLGRVH